MLIDVAVPDIGDFGDVPVAELLVAVGDVVSAEQSLIVLESDKASMEVPAGADGTLAELLVDVGSTVSAGDVIARLQASGAVADAASDGSVGSPATSTEGQAEADDARSGAVGGSGAEHVEPTGGRRRSASGGQQPRSTTAIYASPSARRLARELGVDLAAVQGSGRGGRITLDDVRRPQPVAGTTGAGDGTGLTLIPWPDVDFESFGEVERKKLSRIGRLSRDNLARNWVHIPHVTHHDEADITELEEFRRQLNTEQSDAKVTMVSLLLKACAATLKVFPNVNSSLDGDELVLKRYYHLGFAADTPHGLVVPVVHDVDQKGLVELAFELAELSGKARGGKLSPGEMRGGTFTVSSLGGIGGTAFTPIVNAPEVAILGVVRAKMKPVWDGERFEPRLMLPLSLSYDHRVVDGAEAARFTAHLASVLGDFRRVLL